MVPFVAPSCPCGASRHRQAGAAWRQGWAVAPIRAGWWRQGWAVAPIGVGLAPISKNNCIHYFGIRAHEPRVSRGPSR